MKKLILTAAAAVFAFGISTKAQTNLQIFYDFGKDRKCVTTTMEGFYGDKWGNTFFFIDHDYPTSKDNDANKSITGTYWEISRCLNFWQDSKLGAFSLQVEYDGGAYRSYPINHSFLAGIDYFAHSKDFKNTFNFKLLYKAILGQTGNIPMQFTFVWGMQDLFNVKGLRFSGFADIWGEKHTLYSDKNGSLATPETSSFVFISEPQIWYNIGQHFGCDNLNIGSEIELSYDFGSSKGFWCRPCAGIKWIF